MNADTHRLCPNPQNKSCPALCVCQIFFFFFYKSCWNQCCYNCSQSKMEIFEKGRLNPIKPKVLTGIHRITAVWCPIIASELTFVTAGAQTRWSIYPYQVKTNYSKIIKAWGCQRYWEKINESPPSSLSKRSKLQKSYMRSAQLITQLKCNLDVNACVFCENKPESLNPSWLQSSRIQLPRLITSWKPAYYFMCLVAIYM